MNAWISVIHKVFLLKIAATGYSGKISKSNLWNTFIIFKIKKCVSIKLILLFPVFQLR